MNPVVTARVPEGIRMRGLEVLEEIGATTSELVNAAFAYVIQERKLPLPQAPTETATGKLSLEKSQGHELAAFLDSIRVPVPQSWSETPFEDLYAEAMEGRYADIR